MTGHSDIGLLFMLIVACGMAFDLVTFRIPNAIPMLLTVLFVAATLTSPDRVDWLGHLGAGLLMLAIGATLFHFHLIGGGDAKLMGAIALWFGWARLTDYALAVAVLGGGFGVALIVARYCLTVSQPYWSRFGITLPRVLQPREDVPYGLAIGGAAFVLWVVRGTVAGP
jgi:prepilin peptidase CpaA